MQTDNFWSSKKNRSAIFLILWIIFFLFVFFKYAYPITKKNNNTIVNNVINNTTNDNDYSLFIQAKEKLVNNNYDYKYTIISDSKSVMYEGNKKGIINKGKKIENDTIIEYEIEYDIVYTITNNQKEEYGSLEKIKYNNYLDVNDLLTNIKKTNITKDNEYYIFNLDDFYGKILVVNEKISRIELSTTNETILMEFSNVIES